MYKTKQDLDLLVEKVSLKPLLTFTKSYLEGLRVDEFIRGNKETKSLKEQYQELYPDIKIEEYKRFGNTLTKEVKIEYIEYSKEKEIIEDEETKIVPDLELTDEEKEKIENKELFLRPTFEYYKQKRLDEFLKDLEITDEEIKETVEPYFVKIVSKLADKTTEQAKSILAGIENISLGQIERYKVKYKLAVAAKNGDEEAKNKLMLESELKNVDIDSLIDIIIELGEQWENKLDDFITLIDAFRVSVKQKFTEDYKGAFDIASKANKLGAEITPDKLRDLFTQSF